MTYGSNSNWRDSGREITQEMIDEVLNFEPEAEIGDIWRALEIEHGVPGKAAARLGNPPNEVSPPISPHTPTMTEGQGAERGNGGTKGKSGNGGKGSKAGKESKGGK